MSDAETSGFVDRPATSPPRRTVIGRIEKTAENGKAILLKVNNPSYGSGYAPYLKKKGLVLRRLVKGAPEGHIFLWAEKIAVEDVT